MMVRAAVVLLLLSLLHSAAHADKRVALVIGNSAYKHAGELANPRNDATDMAVALKQLSFQVIEGFDLDKASLDRKIRDFAAALSGADLGLFFYAGHGLQVAGQNYIVPVDAELMTAASLDFEMVRLDLVHRTMEREAQTNILFLDACRNNPLARNLARALGTRSTEVGRGLAAVESGSGTLISFSTQPGNVASDGSGRNSPFTGPLVKHIASSNDDLSAVLIAVRNDVMSETKRKQVPWEHSALTKRIYFNAPVQAKTPTAVAPPASLSEAGQTWAAIKDSTNQSVLEAFVKQFGDTVYGALARARLDELRKLIGDKSAPAPPKTSVVAVPAPQPKALPKRDPGELSRVEQLGCHSSRVSKDRLVFEGGQNAGFKALRIKSWSNDVEIEEVIVRYAGAVRPAHLKGMLINYSQTGTVPMPLEDSTQPVSQVVVAYSTLASYPPGNPSLCVEGLN
jgi:hypothetical protein